MYDRVLHNRWSKLATAVAGAVLMAVAINLFIVPQGLYTGGLLGLCQVIRTLLVTKLGVTANFDIAGLIYLASNVPLLLLAYKTLGRTFVLRLTICTVVNSLSMSIIPVPAQPIIPDLLTSCMVGGILVGFSSGLMLTCGGSSGGMDILGLYLSKKGTGFTVGKFSLLFNAMLYTLCLLLFNAQTAIYSAIYTVFSSLFVDRVHQQNITVQVTIMTKVMDIKPFQAILHRLDRGLTRWTGQGAYTGEPVQVLCICVSKYELETLQQEVDRPRRVLHRAGGRPHGREFQGASIVTLSKKADGLFWQRGFAPNRAFLRAARKVYFATYTPPQNTDLTLFAPGAARTLRDMGKPLRPWAGGAFLL